jgi:RNA polymerase-binding transcription factor DksA
MSNHLTPEFIQSQKKRLEEEKNRIAHDIEELKKDDPFADPDYANDNAAVDNDVREQYGHQNISAQIENLEHRLTDINHALQKIEKGHYGYCEKSNKAIPKERLEMVPEARFLVSEE